MDAAWFSSFFEKPFVNLVKRRFVILTLKFCRSTKLIENVLFIRCTDDSNRPRPGALRRAVADFARTRIHSGYKSILIEL